MRISDWSSDVCSSDLHIGAGFDEVSFILLMLGTVERPEWIAVEEKAIRIVVGDRLNSHTNSTFRDPIHQLFRDYLVERPCRVNQIGRASCRERVCQTV